MLGHAWSTLLVVHPCPATGRGKESPPASPQLNSNTIRNICFCTVRNHRRKSGDRSFARLILTPVARAADSTDGILSLKGNGMTRAIAALQIESLTEGVSRGQW